MDSFAGGFVAGVFVTGAFGYVFLSKSVCLFGSCAIF